MKFWIIYILVQISFFGGTALGRFSQCFFFTFSSSTNQGDRHFFSENPLEFVGLTLYPWKFHTKQSFTPGNSTKSCYTTWLGLFQKKSKQGKSSGYIFLNPSPLPPWNFSFFYFTPGNSRQNKVQPLDIPQNCVKSLGNSKAKNKDSRKFHITLSWSP